MALQDSHRRRILGLFPMKNLAQDFDTSRKSDKNSILSEIIGKSTDADITQWVFDNFESGKHHVHVVSLDKNLKRVPTNILLKSKSPAHSKNGEALFFLDLKYKVTYRLPDGSYDDEELEFKWPVKITLQGNNVLIKIILMEKKSSAYLDAGYEFVASERDLDERMILTEAFKMLSCHGNVNTVDLNKGIKAIWESGSVDSRAAKWKTSVSTTTHQMDEKRYLRADLPQQYQDLVKSPLMKTLFEAMNGAEKFPKHFATDPTSGTITFPTYSDSPDHPRHVVGEILTHN